jgi:hypothetical protein
MSLSSTRRFASNGSTAVDPVQTLLRARGCPERIVEGGISGLVEDWEQVVAHIAAGYKLGLDDWLNDMDVRQILADSLALATTAAPKKLMTRIRAADEKLKELVAPAGRCLWGDGLAKRNGWTLEKNWWYFMRPRQAAADLLQDLGHK